jgi:hypothetical protein
LLNLSMERIKGCEMFSKYFTKISFLNHHIISDREKIIFILFLKFKGPGKLTSSISVNFRRRVGKVGEVRGKGTKLGEGESRLG